MDSEKYQYRPRDWEAAGSMVGYITRLNEIRRRHAGAVASMRTLRLHHVSGEELICFSRRDPRTQDVFLVVANLDPYNVREGSTWLDLEELGLAPDQPFQVQDELSGVTYDWRGADNFVRLDPREAVAHVFALQPGGSA
jgi:starch synthase (maltosyl-transferring)